LPLSDYARLGGHINRVRRIEDVIRTHHPRSVTLPAGTEFPTR
jgi:hypothetical protein